jgi:hypothetical protein
MKESYSRCNVYDVYCHVWSRAQYETVLKELSVSSYTWWVAFEREASYALQYVSKVSSRHFVKKELRRIYRFCNV